MVKNLHIAGLITRLVAFHFEVLNAVSASTASMRLPDIERLKSYLNALKAYKAWFMSQDPIDAPHWHTRIIDVPAFPAFALGENKSINDILLMMEMLYMELTKCQSKDLPNGLISHDSNRFDALVAQLEAFIVDYVEKSSPIDMPESAQSEVQ